MKKLLLLGFCLIFLAAFNRLQATGLEKRKTDKYFVSYIDNVTARSVAADDKLAIPIPVADSDNIAPTVIITSPANSAKAVTGDVITITASATDSDGTVEKVEFFINGSKISEDATAPYQTSWISTVGGAEIKAIAIDNEGALGFSTFIQIEVYDNFIPSITITSPATGALFAAGGIIPITAETNDVGNTVSKVSFYVNGEKVGEDETAPYQLDWQSALGSATITAISTGSFGVLTTSSPVTIHIGENLPPSISITSPANASTAIAGNTVYITADAADSDGAIAKVEFYVNGNKIGEDVTAPYQISWLSTLGTANIKAIAIDNGGLQTTSAIVQVEVYDQVVPTIAIVSPAANATFIVGDLITITAATNDPGGTVAKVEFYVNGNKIGEDEIAPYQFNWTGVQGTVTLTAVSVGNAGVQTTSAPVIINVVEKSAPTVSISSPLTGSTFILGNVVSIIAAADDIDGTVSKVEFFVNGSKIGEDATAPYQINWASTLGTIDLKAVATDNEGLQTASAIVQIQVYDNVVPTVDITSPVAGAEFKVGQLVPVTAVTNDPGNTIAKVEFFVNGNKVGEDLTAPYQYDWLSTLGEAALTAVSVSNTGVRTTSDEVLINIVANAAPKVTITYPTNGGTVIAGEIVYIIANATDDDGAVAKVEFFINGNKIGEDVTAPYQINWISVLGTADIKAVATDNAGLQTTSAIVKIEVYDNVVQTIEITSPTANAIFISGDIIPIKAVTNDVSGTLAKVVFYVNGIKVGEDDSAPYQFDWESTSAGIDTLTAASISNLGLQTNSAPVIITIKANLPPTVTITSPASGSVVITGNQVAITATAADNDGTVSKVEFFVNATKIGEDATAPYQVNWISTLGTTDIKAVATDNKGLQTVSGIVTIEVVNNNALPTVSITSPASGVTVKAGNVVILRAAAADADGTVSLVEFYVNGAKVGEDAIAPYQYNWNSVEGTATIKAIATDNKGGKGTSAGVTISVVSNFVPTVTVISPANGATVKQGNTLTIRATAADADGTISLVEFYVNGVKIGQDATVPYQFNWVSVAGPASITAVATDNKGGKGTSAAVVISVVNNFNPTVAVTAPANGAVVKAGNVVPIRATAADQDGTISLVEFYVNGIKVGQDATAPFQFNWSSIEGTASITAVATDNKGGKGTSAAVVISVVANFIPTVTITAPESGTTVKAGKTIILRARATDTDGSISLVEFYVNGIKVGQDVTAPYQFSWTSIAGIASITAIATDNKGGKGTSGAVTISVVNNAAAIIAITSPSNGAIVKAGTTITIRATATDADGSVTLVEFYVNSVKVGQDASAPYQYRYRATTGVKNITAVATDNDGTKSSTSIVLNVTPFSGINDSDELADVNEIEAEELQIAAYPNPFSSSFSLDIKKPSGVILINVFDMIGKLIYTADRIAEDGKLILGSDLPNGVYTVQVVSGNQVKSLKVIKQE